MGAQTGGSHHALVKEENISERHKNAPGASGRRASGDDDGGVPKSGRPHGLGGRVRRVMLELDSAGRLHLLRGEGGG